jgi:hypothetical protein
VRPPYNRAVPGSSPGAGSRLALGACCSPEEYTGREHVVTDRVRLCCLTHRWRPLGSTVGRVSRTQVSNSSLIASHTRATVDIDSVASGPRPSTSAASTSRADRTRTRLAITGASNA